VTPPPVSVEAGRIRQLDTCVKLSVIINAD